jgi:hypothetical protein
MLSALVAQKGDGDWLRIAEAMPGRNARQCKDRWSSYLAPNLEERLWTTSEDMMLVDHCRTMGPKWVKMAHYFEGRSDAMLKNRYHALQHKSARGVATAQGEPPLAPPPPAPAVSVPQTLASEPAHRQKEPLPEGNAELDGWIAAMLTVAASSVTTAQTLASFIVAQVGGVPTTAADEADAKLARVDAWIEATSVFEALRPTWWKCRGRQA